jgi:hypothetical protein
MTDEINVLALRFVGGRLNPEPSRAIDSWKYSGPSSNGVRFSCEKGVRMNDKELNAYCEGWLDWCYTRKFFIPPGAKNILARMQPAKIGVPPNAAMSADFAFFNMAVHALADMRDADAECFVKYYVYRVKNIKAVAGEMDIGRRTFYDRVTRFARRAYSMSLSMKRAHMTAAEQASKETEDID